MVSVSALRVGLERTAPHQFVQMEVWLVEAHARVRLDGLGHSATLVSSSFCNKMLRTIPVFLLSDMCFTKNNNVMNGANSRSLILVVQTTNSMLSDIGQLRTQINYLISQANQQTIHQPGQFWFTKFVLITFDNIGN